MPLFRRQMESIEATGVADVDLDPVVCKLVQQRRHLILAAIAGSSEVLGDRVNLGLKVKIVVGNVKLLSVQSVHQSHLLLVKHVDTSLVKTVTQEVTQTGPR